MTPKCWYHSKHSNLAWMEYNWIAFTHPRCGDQDGAPKRVKCIKTRPPVSHVRVTRHYKKVHPFLR